MYINRFQTFFCQPLDIFDFKRFQSMCQPLDLLIFKKIQSNFLDYILSKETIRLGRLTL